MFLTILLIGTIMSSYTYGTTSQKWDKTTQTPESDSDWNPPDSRKPSIGDCDRRGDSVTLSSNSGTKSRDSNSNNDKEEGMEMLKEVGWFALKTAGISAATLGGIAIAIPALGFGAAGVTVGSLAAAYQSAFLGGTIASGGTFAALQSIGAAGLAASTKAGIIAGSAVVSARTSADTSEKEKK